MKPISDLNGIDIKHHLNDPEVLIEKVREWFIETLFTKCCTCNLNLGIHLASLLIQQLLLPVTNVFPHDKTISPKDHSPQNQILFSFLLPDRMQTYPGVHNPLPPDAFWWVANTAQW